MLSEPFWNFVAVPEIGCDAAQMSAYIVVSAKVMESSMHRRNILAAALASAGTLFSAARAHAAAPDATKVVYHLDDLDKVDFVLGNIANHYSGMGGPDKVTIALVIHGPALKAFLTASATPDVTKRTGEMAKTGLQLHACINTRAGAGGHAERFAAGLCRRRQGRCGAHS